MKYYDSKTGEVRELLIGTTPNYCVIDEDGKLIGLFSEAGIKERFSPVGGEE